MISSLSVVIIINWTESDQEGPETQGFPPESGSSCRSRWIWKQSRVRWGKHCSSWIKKQNLNKYNHHDYKFSIPDESLLLLLHLPHRTILVHFQTTLSFISFSGFWLSLIGCYLSTLSNPKAECFRGCNRCSTWELFGGTDGLTMSEVKFTYDSPHVTWRARRDPIKSRSGKVQQLLRKKTFLWAFFKQYCLCPHLGFKDRFHFYLFVSWAHHELWSDLKKFKWVNMDPWARVRRHSIATNIQVTRISKNMGNGEFSIAIPLVATQHNKWQCDCLSKSFKNPNLSQYHGANVYLIKIL